VGVGVKLPGRVLFLVPWDAVQSSP